MGQQVNIRCENIDCSMNDVGRDCGPVGPGGPGKIFHSLYPHHSLTLGGLIPLR
jgi:hypothetical protein